MTAATTGAPAGRLASFPTIVTAGVLGGLVDFVYPTVLALAQEQALSRTAVQARMARLEREKVILGYQAIRGRDGSEDEGLGAVLSLTFSQRPCRPVVDKFRHWPEITSYYSVTGPEDAYVVVRVSDAQALSQLVDRLSALTGVASVRSSVVLKADLN